MQTVNYWVEILGMQSHPEGGYFAETYRSPEQIAHEALPSRFSGNRSFGTAIYFMLESYHFSALHRIQSDEIWHFYTGCPLNIYVITNDGQLQIIRLGDNPVNGEVFQAVVPAGCWFGAKPCEPNSYSLVGCTVAPGFDFADFELGTREQLQLLFPDLLSIVELLTA